MIDRWVLSAPVYNETGTVAPLLKQFPLTCETGPGSPSGHAMRKSIPELSFFLTDFVDLISVTASVWFILISSVLRHYQKHKLPTLGPLQVFLWTFYACSIVLVTISRLYLSAHFPHQCLLGAILGLMVAVTLSKVNLNRFTLLTYVTGTVFMLTIVVATYGLLMLMRVDPGWTLAKAIRYCAKREHVHLDTTPFFSIMRYTGFFLGAGIGLNAAPEPLVVRPPQVSRPNESMKVRTINLLKGLISIGVIYVFNCVKIPTGNMPLFYTLSFLMNSVQPILFIAVIPKLVSLLIPMGITDEKKKL